MLQRIRVNDNLVLGHPQSLVVVVFVPASSCQRGSALGIHS